MKTSLPVMGFKLRLLAVLSSLLLLAPSLRAHEMYPTVADFSVTRDIFRIELQVQGEVYLLGVDLDGLTDTSETGRDEDFDSLRALPPETLAPMLRSFFHGWAKTLVVEAPDVVVVDVVALEVPEVENPDTPRISRVVLQGELETIAQLIEITWPRGAGDVALRQQGVPDPWSGFLTGGESSGPIPVHGGGAVSAWGAFVDYIPVGFDHILPKGLDHILFVLGLFFFAARLRPLLWQVSAFTLAHTVTLALGALGWVSIPGFVVEPLIALSIAFVAAENILSKRLTPWRPAVVFGFGLLHGLGFASVLEDFGIPEAAFLPALLGFNVGVEIGQLTVIALAFLAVGLWFRNRDWYHARIEVPASAVIGLVGLYWFIERIGLL